MRGNLLAFDIGPLRHMQQVEFVELASDLDADEFRAWRWDTFLP